MNEFFNAACIQINGFRQELENIRLAEPVQVEKISEILQKAFLSLTDGLNVCKQNLKGDFEATHITACINLLKGLEIEFLETLSEDNAKIQTTENKLKIAATFLFILHKEFSLIKAKNKVKDNKLNKIIEKLKEVFAKVQQTIKVEQQKVGTIKLFYENNALWNEKVKEFKEQITALNEQVGQLFVQTGDADQQLKAAEDDFVDIEKNLEGVNQQIVVDEEKVAEILVVFKEHAETVKGLEQNFTDLAKELNTYDDDVSEVVQEVDTLKKEVALHKENVETIHHKLEKISKTFDKLDTKVDDLIEQEKNLDLPREEKQEHWLKKLLMKCLRFCFELCLRLIDWVIRAYHWCVQAYHRTASDLFIGINAVSSALKERIAPLIGNRNAELLVSPIVLIAGVVFLLYRAQVLKPALLLLCVGSLAYHAVRNHFSVQNPEERVLT